MNKLTSTLPNMLLSLTGICIIVAGILAGLNLMTQEPIAQAQVKAKVEAIAQVTPKFDNNPYEEQFRLLLPGDKDSVTMYPARMGDEVVGYAIETYTNAGFSGWISIMVGIDTAARLVDFSVLEISETPGLGSKIDEWFHSPAREGAIQDVRQIDLSSLAPLKVTKDGGQVDAITAATISSRAFLDAVNRGYEAFKMSRQNAQ
ncbi:RnfABCDGE type electron transport complex subunit G [Porphyromonas sp. COT-239 OH1446]|uniref:RnfABCDGE type electron transport complex subunit G n=1 Tax=Porphyromonas sp. COT-239 OH1446 TaxID=1515613 RepID=UPI00052D4B9F|nr:RnfABCDGE type electron transport complex subunit G [Porphyromonas sp. COT-239 OH1446]KGN71250.1 electron transporter RnfG [Porphyromonas sp. COT-239 OH1446]